MYNVNRKDYFCLLNMLDAIDKIKQYSSPFASADDFSIFQTTCYFTHTHHLFNPARPLSEKGQRKQFLFTTNLQRTNNINPLNFLFL